MQSDDDYARLITRMTPFMHNCVRGFLLKHGADGQIDDEDIEAWIRDDLASCPEILDNDERELVKARCWRSIRTRVDADRDGGRLDCH